MGSIPKRKPQYDFPPLPPLGTEEAETHDRFGLPLRWSLLGEDELERRDRIAAVDSLVVQAVDSVVRQVGREEARRLFKRVLKDAPAGKQPNIKRNQALLQEYATEIARGTPKKSAVLAVAKRHVKEWEDPEPVAHHLRKLIREADRSSKAYAEWLAKFPPLIFDVDVEADL